MSLRLPYSVNKVAVATWNPITEQWGTPQSVQNIQTISFVPEHDTDELKILGAVEELLSVLVSAMVTFQFGGIDWTALTIMGGMDDASSGGDTHINAYEAGGEGMPYFGLAYSIPLKGGAEMHMYVPKCQLTKNIPLEFDMNKFATPSIDAKAVRLRLADNTLYQVGKTREKSTATALPTNFNTAFASLQI
jgi:hypothetical protein